MDDKAGECFFRSFVHQIENVLLDEVALWWSNNGAFLCYAMFDDTQVQEVPISYYGSYTNGIIVNPYVLTQRYPKVRRYQASRHKEVDAANVRLLTKTIPIIDRTNYSKSQFVGCKSAKRHYMVQTRYITERNAQKSRLLLNACVMDQF